MTTVVCTVQRSHLCTTVSPLKKRRWANGRTTVGHHRLNGAQFQRYGKIFLTRTVCSGTSINERKLVRGRTSHVRDCAYIWSHDMPYVLFLVLIYGDIPFNCSIPWNFLCFNSYYSHADTRIRRVTFIHLQVKFGVKRERVPFVLAHDFEIIIEKHFGFDK